MFCVLFIFLAIYIFWFSVLESRRKNRNVSRTTSFLIGCWVVLKNEKGDWWLGGSKFDSYFKLFRFFLNLASYFTWNLQRFKDIARFCNKIRFSNVKSSKTRERKGWILTVRTIKFYLESFMDWAFRSLAFLVFSIFWYSHKQIHRITAKTSDRQLHIQHDSFFCYLRSRNTRFQSNHIYSFDSF